MYRLTELLPDSFPAVKICRYTTTHLETFGDIAAHMVKDNALKSVLSFTQTGWSATITEDYEPYYRKQIELAVNDNCVLWGERVIIPKTLQRHILDLVHTGQPGTLWIKQKA
ncbi:Hypothetical predicted protein [Pelobates cultripes]|uniref:Uncharacterized protein n=1 Tax=Pelobates cultripes TaxID=61616 RepID=A0AAD1WCE3_PELCU|nr:Hypothetical predicted protein [Pelobates cultripes]